VVVGALSVEDLTEHTQIVGIVLARDEDIFLERAVRNAAGFCDHWIFLDHKSQDATRDIFQRLADELPSAEFHALQHPDESHDFLKSYAGRATWIFGLDGDEIYDPMGLARLRERILGGEFRDAWMILGNVVHVTSLAAGHAHGHTTPPCRSMTKLYHFGAIAGWDGYCPERLHGGEPRFRPGFSADARCSLYESVPWDAADFRCLHMCFLPRSSRDKQAAPRANLMETQGVSRWDTLLRFLGWRKRGRGWKNERYRRGPEVVISTQAFGL